MNHGAAHNRARCPEKRRWRRAGGGGGVDHRSKAGIAAAELAGHRWWWKSWSVLDGTEWPPAKPVTEAAGCGDGWAAGGPRRPGPTAAAPASAPKVPHCRVSDYRGLTKLISMSSRTFGGRKLGGGKEGGRGRAARVS